MPRAYMASKSPRLTIAGAAIAGQERGQTFAGGVSVATTSELFWSARDKRN